MNRETFVAAIVIMGLLASLVGMEVGVTRANPVAFQYPSNPHTIISVESLANLTRWETDITLTVSLNLSLWYPSYIFSNPFYNYTYACSLSSFDYVIDGGKYLVSLLASDTVVITPQNLQMTSQGITPAPQFLQVSKRLDLGFLSEGNHSLQVKTTTNGHYYKGGQEHWDPIYDSSDTLSFFIGLPTIANPTPTPIISPTPIVPQLAIISAKYQGGNASFNFTSKQPCSWLGYSLDNGEKVTITEDVITTGWNGLYNHYLRISDLAVGKHNITFYAKGYSGNSEQSNTFSFTVNPPTAAPTLEPTESTQEPTPFQNYGPLPKQDYTLPIVLAIVVVIAVAVGALVYFKRRKL